MLIQYERGKSLLHRFDPLSKLAILMCTAVLAMVLDRPWQQGLLLGLCIGAARYGGRLSWGKLLRGIRLIAVVAVPYFVLTGLTVRGETAYLQWGALSVTAEGLSAAGAMTLRMVTLFLSSFVYIVTTDPRELVAELNRRLSIPYRFAFGISTALTFIPLLEAEGAQIREARQVRGHRPPKGIAGRVRYALGFISAVLLNALRRVQQTAGAMEAKGFGAYPDRTFRQTVALSPWCLATAAAYALLTVLVWWIA